MQNAYLFPLIRSILSSIATALDNVIYFIIEAAALQTLLPFIPWHDVFTAIFIILAVLVVIVILGRLRSSPKKPAEPPVVAALQEVATRENRNIFLDIFESMYNDVMKKFEEAKAKKALSPAAANIMSQAFTEYNTIIARVLRPLGATTDELKQQLEELRKSRLQLESEIDELESKMTTKPSIATGIPGTSSAIGSSADVDGDALVGAMLKEIKNIADEYGVPDITQGLDIKDALDELGFDEE
ncbi:MAG: hypothetical protein ACTSW4_05915 [Candidatus Ranarchaeia archaeon]